MKNTIILAAAATALAAPLAQASVLTCRTEPSGPTRGQYVIRVESNCTTARARLSYAGGIAHFIRLIGEFPIGVERRGPEIAVFSNEEQGFQLTVNYQPPAAGQGEVVLEDNGVRIAEPVLCQ